MWKTEHDITVDTALFIFVFIVNILMGNLSYYNGTALSKWHLYDKTETETKSDIPSPATSVTCLSSTESADECGQVNQINPSRGPFY